jgi:foldase protein PrsA
VLDVFAKPSFRQATFAVSLLLATSTALTSCGGGGDSRPAGGTAASSVQASDASAQSAASTTQSAQPSIPPSTPVATVAGHTITWASLRRRMSVGPTKHEVPEPPDYSACVEHSAKAALIGGAQKTDVQLKAECQARFSELLPPALKALINQQWLSGEARERGMKLDKAAVKRELAQDIQAAAGKLAASGNTVADIQGNIVATQLTDRLIAQVKRRTPRVDHAFLLGYYAKHRQSFALPETRDLHIVRMASLLAAKKARAEIEAGRSFASVVKVTAISQPIETKEGLFRGLTPTFFSEPVLANAIFRARPHVVSGPVKISLGYYVFEVIAVHPPRVKTLAEVQGQLKAALPETLYRQALAQAVAAFRKKWIARTSCRAGFVVQECRGYKGSGPPVDPYTF